jgi:hypothetical protein
MQKRAPQQPQTQPEPFRVQASTIPALTAPFTVNPVSPSAPLPSAFYVDSKKVLAVYLDALLKDPDLRTAYDGFYVSRRRSFQDLWQGLQKQADRIGDLAMLHPVTALPVGTYRTVRDAIGQGEREFRKEFSREERINAQVHLDIRWALIKTASESRVQRVFDTSSSGLLYVDPAWDLTDRVFETLLQAKKAELAEKKSSPPSKE